MLYLAATIPACGQLLSFGIRGGGIATGALDPAAQNIAEAKRYTVGPAVEVRLPFRLALEVDALYERVGQRSQGCAFEACSFASVHGNALRFPALVKYRMLRGPVRPYVSGGVAYEWVRRSAGTELSWRTGPLVSNEVVDYTIHRFGVAQPAESHAGVVAGGGVEWRAGRLRLGPEFRYTRWSGRYWESSGPRGFFTGSNPNQADILFGITF